MSYLTDYKMYNTEDFTIWIDHDQDYGFFEHNEHGDGYGGGLWFEGKELVDYDGVGMLPKEVWLCLQELGYTWDGSEDL